MLVLNQHLLCTNVVVETKSIVLKYLTFVVADTIDVAAGLIHTVFNDLTRIQIGDLLTQEQRNRFIQFQQTDGVFIRQDG